MQTDDSEIRKEKWFRFVTSATFTIAAGLFFFLCQKYHMHYQEQYQLFLCSWSYFADTVSSPGGFAEYIARFLTQFFVYAPAGAAIVAALLCGVQLSCWRCFKNKSIAIYPFSFVPSILLLAFLCDEDALLTAPVALTICLIAAYHIINIKPTSRKLILLVLLVTLMYLFCGTFSGRHYYRYVHTAPSWPWIAALSAALVIGFSYLTGMASKKYVAGVILTCVLTLGGFMLTRKEYNSEKERQLRYVYDVRTEDYEDILEAASRKAPADPLTVTAFNLALAVTGQMPDNMFRLRQNGTQGLFPLFERDHLLPLITAEAYWQSGLVNASQRFTFEAQEAIPDFQKSAYCYQRLAKCAIANGDDAVANKYLAALKQTLFYRKWANNIEQTDAPDKKALRLQKTDFLFNPTDVGAMLEFLVEEHPENRIARDYMMAWYLLRRDIEQFADLFENTNFSGPAPQSYQEAYMLQWSQTHTRLLGLPGSISEESVEKMRDVLGHYNSSAYMKRHYNGTYWYYFFQ